jgi:hypothetical protein
MMSPPWSVLLAWEGHCKPHFIVLGVSHIFFKWGSRYDHGYSEVRTFLLKFAEEKLLCEADPEELSEAQIYAVLSQRLALDTNTTNYLFYTADPFNSLQSTNEQIAKHMRVCIAVEDGVLRGIAPSEPILSEAASRIMSTKRHHNLPIFSLPSALSLVLNKYYISQGDCGELIMASFFTWARDQAVKNTAHRYGQLCPYFPVTKLFQHLLTDSKYTSMLNDEPSIHHPEDPAQSFGTVFKNAMMHFNHVIKVQEQSTLARPYLLRFMARGAAALGANFQPGFDAQPCISAVYPYLYGGTDLDINKVGFIIVQVKNDSTKYADESLDELFSEMEPFQCHLIGDDDKKDGRFPIPIIRIIFLLSGNGNSFKQHVRTPTPATCGRPLFTSYDYVCAGVDENILRPTREEPSKWEALVNKRHDWDSFYNVDSPDILRSQIPASASHDGHFASWSEIADSD